MWGYAERRGATAVDLSVAQLAVLQVIYNEFRASNTWPTMYRVDRALMKSRKLNGARPATLLRKFPEGLLILPQSGPSSPFPQEEIRLTISGVARCSGAETDVEAFCRAVRWCAKQEMTREPEPGEMAVAVTWSQVRRAIPAALRTDPMFRDRIFLLLTLHHWGFVQSARPDGADWVIRLGPEARRFKNVRSIEDFIDVRVSLIEEGASQQPAGGLKAAMPVEVEPSVVRSYIKPQLLGQLREIQGSNWDTTKLVALIEEFDACVHAGHTYAPHALMRTLLDHVPPLFGQRSFAAVVSNHSWGQTDSRYMKKLHAFRDQADDALHRQISHKADPLMHDDLPPRAAVNALLGACIDQLRKP